MKIAAATALANVAQEDGAVPGEMDAACAASRVRCGPESILPPVPRSPLDRDGACGCGQGGHGDCDLYTRQLRMRLDPTTSSLDAIFEEASTRGAS